jgi:hypothetical protein
VRELAKLAYEAYISAMGQKMRKHPARPRRKYGWTKPKGARLWEELPGDEQAGWIAAVAVGACR